MRIYISSIAFANQINVRTSWPIAARRVEICKFLSVFLPNAPAQTVITALLAALENTNILIEFISSNMSTTAS